MRFLMLKLGWETGLRKTRSLWKI